jgi:2,3-bisphosphoglycerate-dependent phosphoglycerate mutase
MIKLVLLRHGQSIWNKERKFTGWMDVDLTEKGKEEAKEAGRVLKEAGFTFDLAFTSLLKRAADTLSICIEEMEQNIPVMTSWRLNERHYGALQGESKEEMAKKVGEDKVYEWRRSYSIRPPALTKEDARYPGKDSKYKNLTEEQLPLTENLHDTIERVLPYWEKEIVPRLKEGEKIIISAHGNSLRALVKYLEDMPEEDITHVNIATGIPLIYELDENLKPIKHYFLGEEDRVRKAEAKFEGKALTS